MAFSDCRRSVAALHPLLRMSSVLALVLSFTFARDLGASAVALTLLVLAAACVDFRGTFRLALGVLLPFAVCTAVVAVVISTAAGPIRAELQWTAYVGRFIRLSGVSVAIWYFVGMLTPSALYQWLTWFRLPRSLALHLTSPLVLIEALRRRIIIIRDARFAQGYTARRGILGNARQLVPVLSLLVAAGLAMAVERGEVWQRDDISELIARDEPPVKAPSIVASIVVGVVCVLVCGLNLVNLPLP
jgi:hypothetical protein